LVSGEAPQLNGSLLHVVLEEVPLQTDVFSLLADQGILGVRDGALVVLPNGGGFGDGGRDEGLESVMPYFARMSRRYLD
jgi:hypothetical protein